MAIGYGSDGTSIAASIGMPVEKAREMVTNILKGMPGMADYKKKTINFLKSHGYIVINPITGHRIYWPQWSTWKAQQDRMDSAFWADYNANHKGIEGDPVVDMVRKHSSLAKDWFNKNVLNYPIQGGGAILMKQAAADLFDWIIEHNMFGKILFSVFVHDEICVECPEEYAIEFGKILENIMKQASGKYYHKLPIPASAEIGSYWIH